MTMSVAKIDGASRITRFVSAASLIFFVCAVWTQVGSAQLTGNAANSPAIVYVSNGGGGITEINTATNSVIATAPFPNNANGVVVSPNGRRIYASNRDVGQVTVFDAATNVPIKVISVGNGNDNLGLAISPDGSLVYVANQVSGTVTVIATATNTVVQTISTGLEPIWITFSPNGSRAYVSNQVSGTVSVISTTSGSVIANIFGFSCPFESKVTLDGSKLLVSSQCDNSLKVVSLASNTIVNSIPTGPNPRGIARAVGRQRDAARLRGELVLQYGRHHRCGSAGESEHARRCRLQPVGIGHNTRRQNLQREFWREHDLGN